jgi:hypothetical protein
LVQWQYVFFRMTHFFLHGMFHHFNVILSETDFFRSHKETVKTAIINRYDGQDLHALYTI